MIDQSAANEAYEGWDAPIGEEADEGGFVLVPEGTYAATVVKLDRERYEPGPKSKLPACWKAVVHMLVRTDGGDEATIRDNVYLTKKNAWKIKQLFVATGQIAADAAPGWTPPWNELVGKDLAIEVSVSEYNGKEYNNVDKYLAPEEGQRALFGGAGAQQPAQGGFSFPGAGA